jgi:cellulose synthase operon protein YhjQ
VPLICFASPKGGVGKTTLAANVSGELARAGYRVVALDLDPQNSLRIHFGQPLLEVTGYAAELIRRGTWQDSLRRTPSGPDLLAYGQTDHAAALALSTELVRDPALIAGPVRDMLADPALAVVADTAPGPSAALAAVLPLTDLLVTVLLVDPTSISVIPTIESGLAYSGVAHSADVQRHAFVLNQVDLRTRLGPPLASAASRHFGERLLGLVHRDETVGEAVAAQRLVKEYQPGSRAARDIEVLARVIAARLAAGNTMTVTPSRAASPQAQTSS